ncbi:hypothetical protein IT568_03855 [bacterium]|nr:hypothetical protein [bacterium]
MNFEKNSFSNLETLEIKNKQIFIFDTHNFAFPIWIFGQKTKRAAQLVTLDTHADTRDFFNIFFRKRFPNASDEEILSLRQKRLAEINLKNYTSVLEATSELANDEHILASLELGIFQTVHVVNHSLYDSKNEKLNFYCSMKIPNSDVLPHECEKNKWFVENCFEDAFFEKLGLKIPQTNFILDIDCDYVTNKKALYPKNKTFFTELVGKSDFITLAREPDFCKNVSQKKIETRLLELFNEIL